MRLKELKSGMLVEFEHDEGYFIVIELGGSLHFYSESWEYAYNSRDFTDTLILKTGRDKIIKVYEPKGAVVFSEEYLELIWERKEYMTFDEARKYNFICAFSEDDEPYGEYMNLSEYLIYLGTNWNSYFCHVILNCKCWRGVDSKFNY